MSSTARSASSLSRPMKVVRIIARLNVGAVVLTNAAGGVRKTFRPGDLMLITDHINAFGTNPLIGPNDESLGARFPDMSQVYDPALQKLAKATARSLRIPLREGVYLGNSGPSYETPAEIRMADRLGADAVGMSTVLEVIQARALEMEVAGFSCMANLATGLSPTALSHDEVLETSHKAAKDFSRILEEALPKL